MSVDHSAIEAELERILHSRCFRTRKALRKFLAFIVQQTLAGKHDSITQYRIATEALGKAADFTAGDNPLVRVQARRLRHLLAEYYASEGRFNPIRITLPANRYYPSFELHAETPAHALLTSSKQACPEQSQGPEIICIPRNFLPDASMGWSYIGRLTRDYVAAVAPFMFCQVTLAEESLWHTKQALRVVGEKYLNDFVLFFDLYPAESGYALHCSLVMQSNQQIIWGHSFSVSETYPTLAVTQQLFKRIAHDTIGVERGLAQDYWVRQRLDTGKALVSHHQVVVTARQYAWNISRRTFCVAVQTCENRLEQFPQDVTALILFADYCRCDYLLKYGVIEPLYQRTAEVVDRLLSLAPNNAYSHLFQAMSCLFQKRYAESEVALLKTQTINPLDTHLNNLLGLGYLGLGQWEKGATFIQDSIDISPFYPDWYHIALCFYHYRAGRYVSALREVQKVKLKHVWTPILRTTLYQHMGWLEKGKQEYQQLVSDYPYFTKDSHKLIQGFTHEISQIVKQLWQKFEN